MLSYLSLGYEDGTSISFLSKISYIVCEAILFIYPIISKIFVSAPKIAYYLSLFTTILIFSIILTITINIINRLQNEHKRF